jgi:ribose/xylose/arabinose/galactoside ABC-type transport system permease subunit
MNSPTPAQAEASSRASAGERGDTAVSPDALGDLESSWRQKTADMLGPRRIGAIYVWIIVIIGFTIWKPGTFFTYTTFTGILDQNAVNGLVALALVVPLAAGVYDLSVGYTLGLASVLMAWLLGHSSMGFGFDIVIVLAVCLLVGVVNGLVVTVGKIDSFIGTLATGSLILAAVLAVSGDQNLVNGVAGHFLNVGDASRWQITTPVAYCLVAALGLWYLLGHTPMGRSIYATGLGREAARLTGVRTERIRFGSLLVSALFAGVAGIAVTAIVGGGSPTTGPSYLIPAFAAAFLGATIFRPGLFNAWGTIVAVLLLGTVSEGLALANVPLWTPDVFQGLVLLGALAISQRSGLLRGRFARHNTSSPDDPPTNEPHVTRNQPEVQLGDNTSAPQ